MCGIVGYIGERDATPIILEGLKRLEYRGYDSAGLAVINQNGIQVRKDSGKIDHLHQLIVENPLSGKPGIGHTRWATHGEPCERNSHPHIGYKGQVAIVHNGIVENFLELKTELLNDGIIFKSDTDTEAIIHLVEKYLDQGDPLEKAIRKTLSRIKGSHGIVVISTNEPGKVFAARIGNAGGIVIGLGKGENFIASDIPPILDYTRDMVFLDSNELAIVGKEKVLVSTIDGKPVEKKVEKINWDPISAVKGNYRHFMHKEIHEQTRSLTDALAGRIDFTNWSVNLPTLNLDDSNCNKINSIKIIACGTAANAGLVGKYYLESIAKIPVEVDIASEFRYRDPLIEKDQIILAISQSGETADTLGAMEEARQKGAIIWSIVNAIGSQAMRNADGFVSMQVGPEIGVASTKAFTAPLLILFLMSIMIAEKKKLLSVDERRNLIKQICMAPDLVGVCLKREEAVKQIATKYIKKQNMLYLGRGINMPIAYEGALKLKEISYIHAEAYPAGEMKHGPIALIDNNMPVMALMPADQWYEKMISQVEQAKTRGGKIIAVASDGDDRIKGLADDIIWIPNSSWLINPILAVIPLQLFAYHIAAMKGLDVDQPRNLAKLVTVE